MTARRKMGRPPLPEGPRGCTTIRISAEERATFEEVAKARGMSLTKWIRHAALTWTLLQLGEMRGARA